MLKAAHLADSHVRNLERHEEYRKVFSQLYSQLKDANVDLIVHCGDIVHQKTNITPELVDEVSNFLRSLAEIAPLFIIPGNHDGIISNKCRQDSITPIVNSLNLPNITFIKNTQRVVHYHGNYKINFDAYSCFDKFSKMELAQDEPRYNNLNIALYHGPLNNSITSTGYALTDEKYLKKSFFDGYDFAMLGDIHQQQILDSDGRIAYCGSTIQQNFGETDDKGCLIWSIESRKDWKVNSIVVPNPNPFITINLADEQIIPDITNARVKVVGTNEACQKFYANNSVASTMSCVFTYSNDDFALINDNIANVKTDLSTTKSQNDFIEANFTFEDGELEAIQALNEVYNKKVNTQHDVVAPWSITSFEWENLFNFKTLQSIDFENKKSIGIFGKNYSGKSSIIEGIIWTIFGRTSKSITKNEGFINQQSDDAFGTIGLVVDGVNYKITRKLKRKNDDVKAELSFSCGDTDLTGDSIRDTDKAIRKVFGSYEDFILLSLSSQFDNLGLVDHKDSRRKEIISKFLGLDFFSEIEPIVKDDITKLKADLNATKKDFTKELSDLNEVNLHTGKLLIENQDSLDNCELLLKNKNKSMEDIEKEIDSIFIPEINLVQLNKDKVKYQEELDGYTQKIKKIESYISSNTILLNSDKKDILLYNIDSLKEQLTKFNLEQQNIDNLEKKKISIEKNLKYLREQEKLVDGVPCGGEFTTCQFIKNAIISRDSIPQAELDQVATIVELNFAKETHISNPSNSIERYNSLNGKIVELDSKISSLNNELTLSKTLFSKVQEKLSETNSSISDYEIHQSLILTKNDKKEQKKIIALEIRLLSQKVLELKLNISKAKDKIEQNDKKILSLNDEKETWEKSNTNLANLEKYRKIVSKNGLPLILIEKVIPSINSIANKILEEVADFTIKIQIVDDKILIYLNREERFTPIEACSGSEKTLASITIRASLYSVTPLSKSKFLILDEPGTSLDKDNLLKFKNLLNILEDIFDTIVVVTHIDELKDTVKTIMEVDKGRLV